MLTPTVSAPGRDLLFWHGDCLAGGCVQTVANGPITSNHLLSPNHTPLLRWVVARMRLVSPCLNWRVVGSPPPPRGSRYFKVGFTVLQGGVHGTMLRPQEKGAETTLASSHNQRTTLPSSLWDSLWGPRTRELPQGFYQRCVKGFYQRCVKAAG